MERNPYAPPSSAVSDTWNPTFSAPVRVLRVFAMMGNVLLALLPVFYLFSGRRPDVAVFLISGYCLTLAICSAVALVSRLQRRMFYMIAIVLNVFVILLFFYLLLVTELSLSRDLLAMFLFIAPALLNISAVVLMRRSRLRNVNAVAT